jgi:hypothetical protein
VERLKVKALSSNPNTTKKRKRKKKRWMIYLITENLK